MEGKEPSGEDPSPRGASREVSHSAGMTQPGHGLGANGCAQSSPACAFGFPQTLVQAPSSSSIQLLLCSRPAATLQSSHRPHHK